MKLYELVNKYHINTSLNCAEAMFKACNEYYNLNLSEETRKMFSVMGIGMKTKLSCCGAFTVAVGIIGLFTAKEGEEDSCNIQGNRKIQKLTIHMMKCFRTLQCGALMNLKITGNESPCYLIVEEIAKELENLLAQPTFLS